LKNDPTIDVAPVHQWFEILSSFGANRSKLLQLLECNESFLLERDNRIPVRCHHAMLHAGAEAIDIPGIILLSGVKTTAQSMGVVGHLMMNSATLLDAGHQIVRFASVLSETGKWSIEKNNNSYDIRYMREDKSESYPEIEEASLASCIGVLRNLSAKEIVPQKVWFSHSDPGYSAIYENVFGLPVHFDKRECLLRISADDAHQAVPLHQSYIHDLLESHARELLEKLADADSVSSRVSQLVAKHLAEGRVDIEWISAQLFMSRWTLTRHLKQEGITFNDLVKDIRSRLAQKYLDDKKMSISEVGFLLGYSEPSAFQRAFRGWYQCTPSEFRVNH
jgi:AraC-like DNA-binding protein